MYNTLPETLFLGKSFTYLPSCHSTNQVAQEMLVQDPNIPEGAVVITSNQTAGRGQRGNTWEAEPGYNLTFSVILKPHFLGVKHQFYLNIITALAVHDILKPLLGKDVRVKWPNDVYYGDKKICGILIQNIIKGENIEKSVIGIGLNINQGSFQEQKAISLKTILGVETPLNDILNNLLQSIEGRYLKLKSQGLPNLKADYLSALYWYKELRTFKSRAPFKGIIAGIDEIGRLQVEVEGSVRVFDFKQIEYVG